MRKPSGILRPSAAIRVALVVLVLAATPLAAADLVNVLALDAGALPVAVPPSYSSWPAYQLLDDDPGSGWAGTSGETGGQTFVFELVAPAAIERFEFDTTCLDGEGRGARNIRVSVSDRDAASGFTPVLEAALVEQKAAQAFAARNRTAGRWVRLEIVDNHGDEEWVELCSFRGYAPRPAVTALADVSGTYDTNYRRFHIRQQGSAIVGCYEYNEGLLTGSVEGRVMKLTWAEPPAEHDGPAVMVFAADGKSFRGHWWSETSENQAPDGVWDGTFQSAEVGSCPHWSGSVGGEVERELAASGRARLYGIEFDLDSATLRAESKPVLDDVAKALASHPDWQLAIEGHTDSTGTPAHNQKLSEARAAAVRDYLTAHGVAASRLTSAGFGASQPVADNATELGRARNRRVEIVRR